MDQVWQSLLGIQPPQLSPDLHTEHFTHPELQTLLDAWCGGNSLENPDWVAKFAEYVYATFDSPKPFFNTHEQMWRDGLGRFLVTTWNMVAEKRGLETIK